MRWTPNAAWALVIFAAVFWRSKSVAWAKRAAYEQKAIPKQQLDDQAALVEQNAGLVKFDQGQVDSAKVQLGYCRITSPINGRVGLRLVDPGNIAEYVDDLLAAARRGELADAHAQTLALVESHLFKRAIELAHGNQAKAARWLGISRITMKAKLVQFGLHPGREHESAP
jgi:DNA-binding protein Fis